MKRVKLDPLSLLLALKEKAKRDRPLPLARIPHEEIVAFRTLRDILAPSRLLPYLDKKVSTRTGERFVCVNEDLVSLQYPGVDPLAGSLARIDAFIYVYEGITDADRPGARTKGDFRQFLGEGGFRQLLVELDRACKIHQFCTEHLHAARVILEPLTGKPTREARKEAFRLHARAKEVFLLIARKLQEEIAATEEDAPAVYRDAYQFACDMKTTLEPLARMGKEIKLTIA
jgi:hypothetical protein